MQREAKENVKIQNDIVRALQKVGKFTIVKLFPADKIWNFSFLIKTILYKDICFQLNGSSDNDVSAVKAIVNKQYNSPVGIYSDESIAETLSAQAEVLAGGVLG